MHYILKHCYGIIIIRFNSISRLWRMKFSFIKTELTKGTHMTLMFHNVSIIWHYITCRFFFIIFIKRSLIAFHGDSNNKFVHLRRWAKITCDALSRDRLYRAMDHLIWVPISIRACISLASWRHYGRRMRENI